MSDHQNSGREQGMEKYFFRASAVEFAKIPGQPIAYWFSKNASNNCIQYPMLSTFSEAKSGMSSCNSDLFLRQWFEVSFTSISRASRSHAEADSSKQRWFPYNKGGGNRRWFGYSDVVINWKYDGADIKKFVVSNPKDPNTTHWSRRLFNLEYFFQTGLTWSAVTSGRFSCREVPVGIIPGTGSKTLYDLSGSAKEVVFCLLNTVVSSHYLSVFSPTLNFEAGDVVKLPVIDSISSEELKAANFVQLSKNDWDFYETSWDFTGLPLLHPDQHQPTLKASYQKLRAHWREMTLEMLRLEEENNRIFIDAYGLQDELTSEVPLNEITLTCNPHYRYGGDKSEEELEALLLADTMRELVSYAVGCMFGRYSLDKPGLILANQGETLADYLAQVPQPSFPADDDNVIPLLDGDWFPDDITLRFRQFLRVAFGDAHYEDNLAFIEQALNVKGKRNYSLRDYFLGEFYADHVKRYKKRPIYWLFSSPKGTFSALVYLHRYRPDTVSVVLNYLRDFRKKLASRLDYLQQVAINPSASQSEKTKASKEADTIKKQLIELDDYERDTLYPLATEQVELDLNHGVKVNYLKLGAALKKIVGLDAKGED
ncbi:BREX-1 system adenine-specific DNA-methyltransferase PglX [Stutzerimonas kunmingensis]|uniref:BREX-1 system adenine-specific DNA-methyltransferase PglX n=1 Tax=Stutzerimonas kunmingensis TaxID=1211807 RepID=UPI00241EAEC8|nr:BREX-1 system adenine-specific DNA-methyltransferase PglX [Stutzerimonas kunmingensis]